MRLANLGRLHRINDVPRIQESTIMVGLEPPEPPPPEKAVGSALVYPAVAPEWRAEYAWSRERGGPGLTVRYFRLAFESDGPVARRRVHVTADGRYRLWLNGRRLGFGPAKGSLARYHFDTYELGPWLQPGTNVLAAEVRWYGENSPLSEVHSPIPGLLVQSEEEERWDTPGRWRVWASRSVTPDTTWYIENAQQFLNHLDRQDLRLEPAGWQQPGFADDTWENATSTGPAAATGVIWGVAPMRTLTPRNVPAMQEAWARFTRSIQGQVQVDHPFGTSPAGWTVPAGQAGRLLLDAGQYVTGFPSLELGGGANREVRVLYAEALGEWTDGPEGRWWIKRGNRDAFDRLEPHGYRDTLILRGDEVTWEPFYWRAFRWLQVEVLPGPEPLTIRDARYRLCVHPQRFSAEINTSDPDSAAIFDVSVRTLRMGAHEIYDDSPYFEQFCYIGDARIEALASLHLCNDPSLPRRTLQLYLDTLRGDGLIDARVPCQYARQTIPYFCLHWIFMVGDFWLWRGAEERALIRQCLVAVDSILVFFRSCLRPDGFVGPTGGWNMVDDVKEWPGGQPPSVVAGGSTYLTCLFIEAMEVAVRLHREAGVPDDARRWAVLAASLRARVRSVAWSGTDGLFVEGVDHREAPFSQHVQAGAINAGVATPAQTRRILRRLCTDQTLIRTNSMQSFYLSRALEKAGGYAQWHRDVLRPWRTALANGLTTWPEYPDPSRSDSHAWAAWPAIDYVRTVLGIRPGAPGWERVQLAPATDGLDWAEGSAPSPHGEIWVGWARTPAGLRFQARVAPGIPVDVMLPGASVQTFPRGGAIDLLLPV